MEDLIIINPLCSDIKQTRRLKMIMKEGLKGYTWKVIDNKDDLEAAELTRKRIIFAVTLGESGINLELYEMLKYIRTHKRCFEGSVGGLIIDGKSELFTKSVAREIVLSANSSGCAFPGRPLVEGTKSLNNYNITAKNLQTNNMGAYIQSGRELIERVFSLEMPRIQKPNLLVLYTGSSSTSNTLALWSMVKKRLGSCAIKEISLRNGAVMDCRGCSYATCRHFGEKSNCFYGGVIVEEVYPAIMECDGLVMICPNYNDAVSANIAAFINRMTALFTMHRFFNKRLYAIIASGYSGSDIVAQQLISGLNMNKTFMLPSHFAMMETANSPGDAERIEDIEKKAAAFGDKILKDFGVKK